MSPSEDTLIQRQKSIQLARAKVEENRRQRRRTWHAEAKLLWERWHTDPLFLLGVGLYWGEGHKTSVSPRLRLCNSDLHLLRVWLAWCQKFLPGIPLVYDLNLHVKCDTEAAKRFWEEQLHIKITHVWAAVSRSSRLRRNTLPNGTLNIQVGKGSLEWYTKMMIWLELAHDLPFPTATGDRISSGASSILQ